MLVLADETLESFFDSGFANSFHLADAPLPSSTVTSPSFLNLSNAPPNAGQPASLGATVPILTPGGAGAGVVPPGKGLRGMLDNIVTDGMRVAQEVRRRMDDAQKELDRGASTRGTEDDDDDEGEGEDQGRDLLEGAEADAGGNAKMEHGDASLIDKPLPQEPEREPASPTPSRMSEVEKSTMFER